MSPDSTSSTPRILTLLAILALAGLVGLQVQQAFRRIGVLRDRQRIQFLNAVERMNVEVASALESDLTRGLERARTLAQVLVDAGLEDSGAAGDAGAALLQSYCASSADCLRAVRLNSPPDPSPGGSAEAARESAMADSEVLWHSKEGVLVFRAYAPASLEQSRVQGIAPVGVELTLQAAPFFTRVRNFQPIEGVGNALVDDLGTVVALDAAALKFEYDFDQGIDVLEAAPRPDRAWVGADRVRAEGARLLISSLGPGAELFRLISIVPDGALDAKAAPVRHEARAIVLTTLLSTLGLLLAGLVLYRSHLRMRVLGERTRELERERVLAERLETSERLSALGLLTAGVAHEINNPLEGIGNYLSLLKEDGLEREKRAQFVERIEHGLDRIRSIVRDLLGFARPGSKSGLFDLATAIHGALDLARLNSSVKGCRINVVGVQHEASGEQGAALVQGDCNGIEQVVLNLLLNAGRATGGGGEIEVRLVPRAAEYILLISDDGEGIDARDLPRLFDPFFTRSGASAKVSASDADAIAAGAAPLATPAPVSPGTGLGLSISYSIVQSHGGSLTASNRPEGGAQFELRLPMANKEMRR